MKEGRTRSLLVSELVILGGIGRSLRGLDCVASFRFRRIHKRHWPHWEGIEVTQLLLDEDRAYRRGSYWELKFVHSKVLAQFTAA